MAGLFFDPVEITINSTIEAWTEAQPDTDTLKAYRWRYNPAAFAIISGDDHSWNVTFRAIKETKKPEAISYGSKDCSDTSRKDSPCSASETASQKYWRIVHVSPPVAGLSVTHTGAGWTADVRFTDLSTGSPLSWLWDFGDGWGSAEQNPEHTYEKSGKYTVTLRTTNKGGNDTATTTVEVTVPEPEENAVSPGTRTVSRAGSVLASIYPSGTVSVVHFNTTGAVIDDTGRSWVPTSLSYSNTVYKFGGGSALFNGAAWIYTNDDPAFSPGSENFTFSAWVYPTTSLSGYGEVWGNWWTNQGGTSLDFSGGVPRIVYDNSGTTKIISGTRALSLNTWSNVVLQGKTVSGASDVTLYVNGVPNGTITGAYNIRKPTSQTRFYIGRASTAHILLQSGTYVDDFFAVKGGPTIYTGPFTPPVHEFGFVEDPPVANFTGSPTSGNRPLTVQFNDISTGSPTLWEWDFGDNSDHSTTQNPLHDYSEMGTYTVNLTTSNSQGSDSEMKTGYITITGGTYTVFVEGIENYHGGQDPLNSPIDIASTFYNNIDGTNNGAIWTGYNEFYDDNTGSKHWSYSESSAIKADDADLALFAGHGWNNRIVFGTNNSYLDLYRTDMKFGASKLKWVSLFACHVLDDETQNQWESLFDGLHILNGFETEAPLSDNQGGIYAAYLNGGYFGGDNYPVQSIRNSWRKTLENTVGNSTYSGAWMWAEPCGEDYLPGYGSFCPAPIKENGNYNITYKKFDCDSATGD